MTERARVLFVSHDAGLYGAQRCLLDLLERLNRQRIEPVMVSPSTGPLTEIVSALGIPVYIRSMKHWILAGSACRRSRLDLSLSVFHNLKSRVWAIASLIQKHAIDVVYTNTVTVLEGGLAARITHRPHIWHLHEVVRGNDELKALLPQPLVNRVVAMLANTRIFNSRFNQHVYGIGQLGPHDRLVYNGIDTKRFSPSNRTDLNQAANLCLPPEAKRIMVVGAIHPRKGMDIVLEAAKRLCFRHPWLHFLIVGEGENRFVVDFKRQVADAGLAANFQFLGWIDNPAMLIASADVLVSAARQEPFGLSVAEAMASGVPVIATRSGGPQEIIVDRESGLLVPVGDADRLADAILEVISNATLARSLGSQGLRRIHESFTLERYVAEIQSCILQYTASPT